MANLKKIEVVSAWGVEHLDGTLLVWAEPDPNANMSAKHQVHPGLKTEKDVEVVIIRKNDWLAREAQLQALIQTIRMFDLD